MFEDAETFFQKTLKLGPNLIEAYYELGRAHWFAGDHEKAKSTWDEAQANKFNPWGKRCQEMLELVAKGEEPRETSADTRRPAAAESTATEVGRVRQSRGPGRRRWRRRSRSRPTARRTFPHRRPPRSSHPHHPRANRQTYDSLTRGRLPLWSEGAAFPT